MFRFTLRDLFWLMLLVAVWTAWRMDRASSHQRSKVLSAQSGSRFLNTINAYLSRSQKESRVNYYGAKFSQWSAEELIHAADQFSTDRKDLAFAEVNSAFISEFVARKMHAELQQRYDRLMALGPEHSDFSGNAELLTALRRTEGKTDPLRLRVDLRDTERTDSVPRPPTLHIRFENVDPDQIIYYLIDDSAYLIDDSAYLIRQERFCVRLLDSTGNVLPSSVYYLVSRGNQLGKLMRPLRPGEVSTIPIELRPCDYVKLPPSGRYQIEVLYSSTFVADRSDLTRMVVWKSDPIAVKVINHAAPYPNREPICLVLAGSVFLLSIGTLRLRDLLRPRLVKTVRIGMRDVAWLVLLSALGVGWSFDSYRLNREILALQLDQDAVWDIKPVSPP